MGVEGAQNKTRAFARKQSWDPTANVVCGSGRSDVSNASNASHTTFTQRRYSNLCSFLAMARILK